MNNTNNIDGQQPVESDLKNESVERSDDLNEKFVDAQLQDAPELMISDTSLLYKDLEVCLKEKTEINNKYTRLYADYENYKKRMIKERDELLKYRAQPFATEMLQILDNLELALSHITASTSDSLVKGVEMTTKELKKILERFGLSEVEVKGKPFDPRFHHAMSMVEREDMEENTVVETLRKGYNFKDRLIRPATVSVSKKPKSEASAKKSQGDSQINLEDLSIKEE